MKKFYSKTNQMQNAKCQMQKSKRGITLIALVITVIVLLILAGVAINLTIDGGGLFSKANEAATSWNSAVAQEESILQNYINKYITGSEGSDLPAGWSPDAVEGEPYSDETTDERVVPIPKGYKVSIYDGETTIANGLVIYESDTDLVADEEGQTTQHKAAMEGKNQYVWIPVEDINDMIMCTSHTSTNDCDVVLDEETGKIYCKNHMTIAQAENKNSDVYLCGRLYGSASSFGTQDPATYSATSGYREPAVVTGDSSADYLTAGTSRDGEIDQTTGKGYHGFASAEEFLKELKEQFYKMAKSVATYGGFYVGRYEAGYDATAQYTTRKGTVVDEILTPQAINASYPARVGNWYGLYSKLAKSNTGTTSQMIWGCQWDQVMKFVDGNNDGNGAKYDVKLAKTTSGSTRHTGSPAVTGANTNDLVQNIYDLEGNFYEWTATAYNTSDRTYRGGFYVNVGAATHRLNDRPTYTSSVYSARPGLFVNL